MFDSFRYGDQNVLISTLSIFAEGIDIPNLDIVINAAANAGNVKTIQVLGRVLRKLEGKTGAYYLDFIDEHRMLKSASFKRRKALINEGHDVEIIDSIQNGDDDKCSDEGSSEGINPNNI